MSKQPFAARKLVGGLFASVLGLAALVPTASAAPQLAAGDTLKLLDGPGGNGGGAFNASVLTGAAAGSSFQTFCLEYNEYFSSYGQTLKVGAVNTGAVNGGVGGQTTPNYDPISYQTAYLYTQFSKGTLSNFSYYTGPQSSAPVPATEDGTSLQLAFWVLENEIAYTSTNTNAQNLYRTYFDASGNVKSGLSGSALAIASQAKSWLSEASGAGWTDIGNVRALNLLKYEGGTWKNSQDQLYITPVPEPETYAMMLAGLGLIGFVARRRRRTFSM